MDGGEKESAEVVGYDKEAIRGIEAFAAKHELDLSSYRVVLKRFLIHPVDSRADVFFITAQIALKAALSSAAQKVF